MSDKFCQCGRLATHFIPYEVDGGAWKKKLACDQFPSCKPVKRS